MRTQEIAAIPKIGARVIERRFGVSQRERDAHKGPHTTLLFSALPPEEWVVKAIGKERKMVQLHSDLHGDRWVGIRSVTGGQHHSSQVGHTITLSGPWEIVDENTPGKDALWNSKQRTRDEFDVLKRQLAK